MKKLFLKILIIAFLLQSGGCTIFQEIAGNGPTSFRATKKVFNKISNPVRNDSRLAVLWIGHSTCLIQMDDKFILTDPVLTTTIGIFSKRVIEPGIETENIPKLDLISVSHPHIDHLSIGTIEDLCLKNSKAPFVFPEGVESYLPGYDYEYIRLGNRNGYEDLNPVGDSVTVGGITVFTVFARHWGGRYGLDGFIWGEQSYTGFIFKYNGLTVYFGGDTGYDPYSFKEIGKRFDINIAMIPIGPCDDCNGCGNKRHVFPEGAVKIFLDLNAHILVPIHYGVFQFRLTDVNEPLYKFKELVKEYGIESRVSIFEIGEQKSFIAK